MNMIDAKLTQPRLMQNTLYMLVFTKEAIELKGDVDTLIPP